MFSLGAPFWGCSWILALIGLAPAPNKINVGFPTSADGSKGGQLNQQERGLCGAAGEVYEVWVMQVILHLWNLNLQGAPGGPTAFWHGLWHRH